MKNLKFILLFMLFIVGVCLLQAQERNRVDSLYSSFLDSLYSNSFEIDELEEPLVMTDNTEFYIMERIPTFWGGDEALMRYLAANLKYPVVSINARLEGRVLIGFYIDEEGRVCDAKVEESVDSLLDAEALRVVKSMPKWLPAKEFGEPVKSEPLTLPVYFRLKEEDRRHLKNQLIPLLHYSFFAPFFQNHFFFSQGHFFVGSLLLSHSCKM